MGNEKLLETLKPIMLDGLEPVGDKVYCVIYGDGEIEARHNHMDGVS